MKNILLIICFFILFCCGFFSEYKNGEKDWRGDLAINILEKYLDEKINILAT